MMPGQRQGGDPPELPDLQSPQHRGSEGARRAEGRHLIRDKEQGDQPLRFNMIT